MATEVVQAPKFRRSSFTRAVMRLRLGRAGISLAHRICISEGRGKARSWATPRPSNIGRPRRNSSPLRKLDWCLAVENRRDRLSSLGPERPVRRRWWRRSSWAGAARVRVEVEVGEESWARVAGASCGHPESLPGLFTSMTFRDSGRARLLPSLIGTRLAGRLAFPGSCKAIKKHRLGGWR